MVVKFLELKIENFKSIENMSIVFKDKTVIRGANETGKSTIADSISWVLTGKNSLGDSTFNIVPIGSVGISPTVELKMSYNIIVDDKEYTRTPTLKRVLKAKIGRDKQYTGEYATECYVNGVKYTQRDFERWISDNICDPEIFKLIHDVRYFTENISTNGKERPWEARRRLLTSICGIEHDNQLVLLDERFKPISERLSEFDDAQQLMTWINGEIATAEKELDIANNDIIHIQTMIPLKDNELPNKSDLITKKKGLVEKRDSMLESYDKEVQEWNDKLRSYGHASVEADRKVSEINGNLNFAYMKLNGEKGNYERYGVVCPTCGRKYSKSLSEKKKLAYEEYRAKMLDHIEMLKDELEQAKKDGIVAYKEYEDVKNCSKPKKSNELESIEVQIAELSGEIAVADSHEKKRELCRKEIERVKEKRDELSTKLSSLQRDADLTKDFISFKMGIVTEKVNSLVDGVSFLMFKPNRTNEDIRPCCDIIHHGVEYSGLSYSEKFMASLHIALAFQKFYGIQFPLLVDNAESIDLGESINTQAILLIKRDEMCPKCNSETGRRKRDGMWECQSCGLHFKKKLEIC